jgi:hypothetical protein
MLVSPFIDQHLCTTLYALYHQNALELQLMCDLLHTGWCVNFGQHKETFYNLNTKKSKQRSVFLRVIYKRQMLRYFVWTYCKLLYTTQVLSYT